MNGCCASVAEGGGRHDDECYWYWPCGCKKERRVPGGPAQPHVHVETFKEHKRWR